MQSYRKSITAARKDKKAGQRQGLTDEQKQEIRFVSRLHPRHGRRAPPPSASPSPLVGTLPVAQRWHSSGRTSCTDRFEGPMLAILRYSVSPGACYVLYREAFDLFDTDGSGTIDAKELKVAMRKARTTLSVFCLVLGTSTWPLKLLWNPSKRSLKSENKECHCRDT